MRVVEIFTSIEGEGTRAGYPCVFVRFAGCNLQCSYCDTSYAQTCDCEHTEMTIDEIAKKVIESGFDKVTLTGGEPLMQEGIYELISALTQAKIYVNVETNGSFEVRWIDTVENQTNLKYLMFTVDYKCPSSGMSEYMNPYAIKFLEQRDALKFVVGSREDMEDALRVLNVYKPKCQVFFSPVFGSIEPCEIVEFLKEHFLNNCRVQLQLHKFIWDPEKRGV